MGQKRQFPESDGSYGSRRAVTGTQEGWQRQLNKGDNPRRVEAKALEGQ